MMMVKGKVTNGIIQVTAVVDGRVVGYRKPLHSKAPAQQTVIPMEVPVYEAPVQEAPKQEALDIPDFMKEWQKKKKEEKRKKRIFKHL